MIRDGMKRKILIIDDDNIYRKIIQKLLYNLYTLVLVENSEEAIQCIENDNTPDLIIADLNMPGLTGVEMIKRIKQKLNKKDIPIIVISGMDDDNIKKELFQNGIADFITKPIERLSLKDQIAHLLNT